MQHFHLITSAAEQAAVCPDTIRNYCRLGLLKPARDSSGRRLFTDADIRRIREIYLDNMARKTIGLGAARGA